MLLAVATMTAAARPTHATMTSHAAAKWTAAPTPVTGMVILIVDGINDGVGTLCGLDGLGRFFRLP